MVGRSSRPLDKRGGGGSASKKILWPFGPQFILKIRGSPAPSPGSVSDIYKRDRTNEMPTNRC